jgi:hypothetical protein
MSGINAKICPSGFSGATLSVAHAEWRDGGLALRKVLERKHSG